MDEITIDIIKEIINIGMGEAANALSELIQSRVEIKIPDVHIINASEVDKYFQNELNALGVYIAQDFQGIVKGKTILCYTRDCSISLLNAVGGHVITTSALNETGIATLNEIGNIIMVSCMSGFSDVINGKLSFNLPEVCIETSEIYFQNLLKEIHEFDKAIIVKNEMRIHEKDIRGYLFMLFGFEDFRRVIEMLSKKMGNKL